MKKILKYSVSCAMAGAVAFSSCSDFLDTKPSGKRTEDEAFSDVASASLVVNGLYDKNIDAMEGWDYQRTMVGTDELRITLDRQMGGGDDNLFGAWDDYGPLFNGNANSIGNIWNRNWSLVAEASKVAYYLADDESDEAKRLIAEARFLRGLTMFKLSVMFGDLPIIDPGFLEENGYARQPQDVVWGSIIDDFQYASDILPDVQTDPQRPTKYSALAMLGKSLMYAGEETGLRDFARADKCFVDIINSGKFDLVPNYKDLWNNAPFEYPEIPAQYPISPESIKTPDFTANGKSESLFTVQFKFPPEGSYSCWMWSIGSWEAEVWFKGEAAYLVGYERMVPNTFMYEDQNDVAEYYDYEYPEPAPVGPVKRDKGVGVWEDGDRRREASIRYEWQYYTNLFKTQPELSFGVNDLDTYRTEDANESYKWIVINERKGQLAATMRQSLNPVIRKFEDFRVDRYAGLGINSMYRDHKPFPVIRYADVLLLHAECLNEAGNTAQAIEVVKQVRDRAWGGAGLSPQWNPGGADEFRDMIMDERMRELAFEGWRRADLIRTGKFVELVKERNDWTKLNPGYINENKHHWPIPIAEIIENADSGWVQNPGYTE